MEEIFRKILQLAVYAPSGDNMQPWKFTIENEALYIYNTPEKDPTLYNYKQRAAMISHGALIENINIIAPNYSYNAETEYSPEPSNPNLTAKITLTPTAKYEHPLLPFIKKRHTNRKAYRPAPLTDVQKNLLQKIFQDSKTVSLRLVERDSNVKTAAAAVCQGDRMIFENKSVHNFLFNHIRWTEQEELKYKNGLYLKTMELAPPQIAAFKIFKHWGVMKIFNAIGFPKLAVKSNFKLYTRGAALVALVITDHQPATYLELGRLLQRFWLTATSLNLNIHPLTGVPFLMQRILDGQPEPLQNYQAAIIKNSYQALAEICGVGEKNIGFFCRLGQAEEPSGLSSRLKPEIKTKK